MVCSSSVNHHTVNGTSLRNDLINGGSDGFFLGDVCLDSVQLVGEALGEGLEVVAGLANVDGVYSLGAVDEAAFCDTETDASICAGD